jgi:hypothetical protein
MTVWLWRAAAELTRLDMGWAPRVRKVSGIGRSLA